MVVSGCWQPQERFEFPAPDCGQLESEPTGAIGLRLPLSFSNLEQKHNLKHIVCIWSFSGERRSGRCPTSKIPLRDQHEGIVEGEAPG